MSRQDRQATLKLAPAGDKVAAPGVLDGVRRTEIVASGGFDEPFQVSGSGGAAAQGGNVTAFDELLDVLAFHFAFVERGEAPSVRHHHRDGSDGKRQEEREHASRAPPFVTEVTLANEDTNGAAGKTGGKRSSALGALPRSGTGLSARRDTMGHRQAPSVVVSARSGGRGGAMAKIRASLVSKATRIRDAVEGVCGSWSHAARASAP